MPRFIKGSPEAKLWGEKMRKARQGKKEPPIFQSAEKPKEPEVSEVKKPEPPISKVPEFISNIVKGYFPEAGLKVDEKPTQYSVEVLVKEGDIRAFVVDKLTADIETENWCKKIKANIEGKKTSVTTGIGLMTGVKEEMKKLPPELSKDKELFFRE